MSLIPSFQAVVASAEKSSGKRFLFAAVLCGGLIAAGALSSGTGARAQTPAPSPTAPAAAPMAPAASTMAPA
ncbi:MAG: hypothetical protein WAM55_08800, partial [Methylovirgula sp.]